MKKFIQVFIILFFCFSSSILFCQEKKIETRIDNWRYWKEKAEQGVIPFNPDRAPKPAKFIGAKNRAMDTPDVLLVGGNATQSENSVFVNPIDNQIALNSNNSTGAAFYGANALFTFDGGLTWTGGTGGAGTNNYGDPAVAISNNGISYIGHINSSYGQGVSITNDDGVTWTSNIIASGTGGILDKNHLWVDNGSASPFQGNLYSAWTPINTGGPNDFEIEIARSTNNGVTWGAPVSVSNNVMAVSHNQGVNLQTGPNGNVYAIWAVYDGWPSRENALGFARSTNGGVTFGPATRIHNNIQGIRWDPFNFTPASNPHGKNMRSNSFPSMAVDISGGSNDGNIYVVWSNVGVPGVNTGTDVSIYMMRSTNDGVSWSTPTRVNQDPIGNVQYFPWITCDPITGNLSVIFYDDRNVGATEVEAWVANSTDGGLTWSDNRVSDVSFTPAPIPGLAGGYMGDYLGISARDGQVYPVWSDNRSGEVLAYTSPYILGPVVSPCMPDLVITADVTNGSIDHQEADLSIRASNTIFSGGEAIYHAGSVVILEEEFAVDDNSNFAAYIDDCNGSFVLKSNKKKNVEYVKADKPKIVDYFKENPSDISTNIFPNPTSNVFTVEIKEDTLNNFVVEIYSISRGLMYKNQFVNEGLKSFQVDISQFPDGVYIVKLIDSESNKVFTGKIIKEDN